MAAIPTQQNIMEGLNSPELKNRLVYVLFGMFLFVIGTHLPTPGINSDAFKGALEQMTGGNLIGMFNMFTGGALKKFSILALGIMPYINASIMLQLLAAIYPKLKEMQQEGDVGRKQFSKITRYLTFILAILQASGLLIAVSQIKTPGAPNIFQNIIVQFQIGNSIGGITELIGIITAVASLVAGSMFMMWLGDQITKKGIGNGVSLLIFIGIVARLPASIYQALTRATHDLNYVVNWFIFIILTIGIYLITVWIMVAVRKVPVQYAIKQQAQRMRYKPQMTFLPLKIAQAGVIPIIFATSLLLLPATFAMVIPSLNGFSKWWQGSPLFYIFEFALVFLFVYVYTAITFNTQDVAKNLQRNGGFIPGIRPGRPTFIFLDKVLNRVTFFGAIFLSSIAVLPTIISQTTHVQEFFLGGTSLLIVVGVALDTMYQLNAHLVMRTYTGLKK